MAKSEKEFLAKTAQKPCHLIMPHLTDLLLTMKFHYWTYVCTPHYGIMAQNHQFHQTLLQYPCRISSQTVFTLIDSCFIKIFFRLQSLG